jgi:hypothetical protein
MACANKPTLARAMCSVEVACEGGVCAYAHVTVLAVLCAVTAAVYRRGHEEMQGKKSILKSIPFTAQEAA